MYYLYIPPIKNINHPFPRFLFALIFLSLYKMAYAMVNTFQHPVYRKIPHKSRISLKRVDQQVLSDRGCQKGLTVILTLLFCVSMQRIYLCSSYTHIYAGKQQHKHKLEFKKALRLQIPSRLLTLVNCHAIAKAGMGKEVTCLSCLCKYQLYFSVYLKSYHTFGHCSTI